MSHDTPALPTAEKLAEMRKILHNEAGRIWLENTVSRLIAAVERLMAEPCITPAMREAVVKGLVDCVGKPSDKWVDLICSRLEAAIKETKP